MLLWPPRLPSPLEWIFLYFVTFLFVTHWAHGPPSIHMLFVYFCIIQYASRFSFFFSFVKILYYSPLSKNFPHTRPHMWPNKGCIVGWNLLIVTFLMVTQLFCNFIFRFRAILFKSRSLFCHLVNFCYHFLYIFVF